MRPTTRVLALALSAGITLAACVTTLPPLPEASTAIGGLRSCPLPREPEYLPWGASGQPASSQGSVSAIRYDAGPSYFVIERRRDAAGAPTSVTGPPFLIYGRATHLLWSGTPGASEMSAWWQEGTGECRTYHARLAYTGEPAHVEAQFARVIGSIPAAFVDPSAGVTGLVAEIPLNVVPSFLAVMPEEQKLYVTDRDPALSVYDTPTHALLKRVPLPLTDGRIPAPLAVMPLTNRVYVLDPQGGRVLVFDGTTLDLLTTIPVGTRPVAIVSDRQAARIYVAVAGEPDSRPSDDVPGSVRVINASMNAVIATVPTLGHPIAIDVGGARVYVAALARLSDESGSIQVIDASTDHETAMIGISRPQALIVDAVDNVAYALAIERRSTPSGTQVVSSKWIELDTRSNDVATFADGPGDVRAIALDDSPDPRYRRVYVATQREVGGALTIYAAPSTGSTRLKRLPAELRIGADPGSVAVDSATHRIYVTSTTGKKISVILQGIQ